MHQQLSLHRFTRTFTALTAIGPILKTGSVFGLLIEQSFWTMSLQTAAFTGITLGDPAIILANGGSLQVQSRWQSCSLMAKRGSLQGQVQGMGSRSGGSLPLQEFELCTGGRD